MKLVIVSGLSGSGKTVALRTLEDAGYYCIDNLPLGMLPELVDNMIKSSPEPYDLVAIAIDARSGVESSEGFDEIVRQINQHTLELKVLFLTCDTSRLLKRFSESRRKHPLANHGTELRAAIESERQILSPVLNSADLIIDTSRTSIYELADAIRERVDRRRENSLSVLIESFGFKNGIPADADFVFDLRCLPNPYWTLELRGLTGEDYEVTEFLDAQPAFITMYDDILAFLKRWIPEYSSVNRGYLTVAVGCTGGQHRSVYMTCKLADALRSLHDPVLTRHNEIGSHRLNNQ